MSSRAKIKGLPFSASLRFCKGLPRWLSGKEPACQCRSSRRRGFNPWVRKIPWSRQPTPVFLPGKSHGQRSLVDYSPWGHKKVDVTEHEHNHFWGFPGGTSGKEPACQCRRCKRHQFDPWAWKIPWKRAWQFTPVFLPEEFYEQRSLAGYSSWDGKELDMTEVTQHALKVFSFKGFILSVEHGTPNHIIVHLGMSVQN